MQVQVQSVHFDADQKLVDFIKDRIEKLRSFHTQILGSEVTLRLDKADNRENKVAEIKLMVPGKDLFAKKQSKSFEEATDNAVDALRKQIEKHKQKISDH
ncbi:MAG: ribosome-associated translation inhibitor RaiA [Flavobacteriales bacterium]|nr:ribosome-associated translation inhibitor RaiA [Flavobacteriales bacterium]